MFFCARHFFNFFIPSTFQDLLDEIIKKKSALEIVRERGEAVAQRSTDPRLSNNMMQLATRYQSLTSSAKVKFLLLQKSAGFYVGLIIIKYEHPI